MRSRALLLAFLVVAASVLTAVQANAAGTVYIDKVYYNSPGSDTGSNSSLNAEYGNQKRRQRLPLHLRMDRA
jgi:hypothetical protein